MSHITCYTPILCILHIGKTKRNNRSMRHSNMYVVISQCQLCFWLLEHQDVNQSFLSKKETKRNGYFVLMTWCQRPLSMSDVSPRVQDIGGCQWRRVESADTGLWVWAAECVGDTAEPAFGVWRWHGALDTWHVSYYYTRVIWNTRVLSVNNKWWCRVKWRMWFLWPAGKSWQSSSGGVHRIER